MKPIPLMILTGFLGAGKTTVLNHLLHSEHNLKIAVMVNDFGAINIDAQLVVDVSAAEDMINLSNGCICCTIRGDLVNAVLQIVGRDDPPDFIVIETSGVTDPLDVILTLRAINRIKIDSVITVIDTEQLLDIYPQYEILTLNQIGTADIVLLNKVDLVDKSHLERVRDFVRKIAPKARILETEHGTAPLEVLLGAGDYDLTRITAKSPQTIHVHESDNSHHSHDNHALVFDTWSWSTPKPLSQRTVQRVVNGLPLNIYRAKGVLFLADAPDERGLLHVVGKRVEVSRTGRSWGEQTPCSQVVVIGEHGSLDSAWLTAQFEACLAENAPKTELEQLANRALMWLRGKRE